MRTSPTPDLQRSNSRETYCGRTIRKAWWQRDSSRRGPWISVAHADLRKAPPQKNPPRLLDRDDMVMPTMSAFVSITAHCARCHDHKFDPIPQKDYYSLQAVFAGVDRADRPYDL